MSGITKRSAKASRPIACWNGPPVDGWDPICDRLGLEVPTEPFPVTNTTDEFRQMVGMPAIS